MAPRSIDLQHSGRSSPSLVDWLCGSPRLSASAASGHSPTRSDHRSGRPRTLTIAHRRDRIFVPVKVRPNVGAFLAAGFAYEPRFHIGEPNVIRPLVCADGRGVVALIVRVI